MNEVTRYITRIKLSTPKFRRSITFINNKTSNRAVFIINNHLTQKREPG